jgi:hypothetical protein
LLDLGSQPETRPSATEIEDWTRHLGVPLHVLAHGISVSEPQDLSDLVGVDQVIDEHATGHGTSLRV